MNNYVYYDWNYMRDRSNNMMSNNYSLAMPNDGFIKGNLFDNLYQGYKNYKPMIIKPKNDREKLLFELQTICFAVHELNLYLDLHPDNQSLFMLFQDYVAKKNSLTKEYEDRYGPLSVSSDNSYNSFKWVNDFWPWEVNNV